MTHQIARTAMVDNQIRPADVTSYALLSAFLNVPRESFVPQDQAELAYAEHEIALGAGRKMMTVRSFAKLVEAVSLKESDKVLLIGAGSGYEAAILASLSQSVVIVESDKNLAKSALNNLADEGHNNTKLVSGSLSHGAAKSGPFDVVIFNGAVSSVPSLVLNQLKPNGRLIAIVENQGVYAAILTSASHGDFANKLVFHASAPKLPDFEEKKEFSFI